METSGTGRQPAPDAAPDSQVPTVSVVIPAYNEAGRIGRTLGRILAFLDDRPLDAEIIVVDDGSTDRTAEIARSHDASRVRIVTGAHQGKGSSVRRGVAEARGRWVLLTDADLSAPIEELDRLMEAAVGGADIAIGSRAVDRSRIEVHQPRPREWGGIVYNWGVQAILGLRIRDTQCGFKLFDRRRCAPLFRVQTIAGFGFDPEILFLAKNRGLAIAEVPVRWSHDAGTTIRVLADGARMFLDLFRIRWRWWRGRYR